MFLRHLQGILLLADGECFPDVFRSGEVDDGDVKLFVARPGMNIGDHVHGETRQRSQWRTDAVRRDLVAGQAKLAATLQQLCGSSQVSLPSGFMKQSAVS